MTWTHSWQFNVTGANSPWALLKPWWIHVNIFKILEGLREKHEFIIWFLYPLPQSFIPSHLCSPSVRITQLWKVSFNASPSWKYSCKIDGGLSSIMQLRFERYHIIHLYSAGLHLLLQLEFHREPITENVCIIQVYPNRLINFELNNEKNMSCISLL